MKLDDEDLIEYIVYEFDHKGEALLSDKRLVLNKKKMHDRYNNLDSTYIILSFFNKFFNTMKATGGFFARCDADLDNIVISWRTPQWKLVKIL